MILDRAKLAKICGMFGSAHEGERAAAALLADQLVRVAGLTWQQVLNTASRDLARRHHPDDIETCLANLEALTSWEQDFVYGVAQQFHALSEKLRF